MIIPPPGPSGCARGAPAWMTTFADMMTLLLCLFVLLLTFAEIDVEKYRAIAQSMRVALNPSAAGSDGLLSGQKSPIPMPEPAAPTPQAQQEDSGKGLTPHEQRAEDYTERLRELLKLEIADQKLVVDRRATEIIVRLQEKASFPSGSADLQADFSPILTKLAQAAREIPGSIIVTGHTDDRPIGGVRFHSNWELSAARAATVVESLIATGAVDPARLEARGMAEHRPLAPNDSEANQAINRRVDISFAVANSPGEAATP